MLHDRTDPNELEVVLIEDESALPIERQYALLTVNYYSVAAVCAAHRIIRRFRGPDLGLGPIEKVALAGRQAAGRIDHDLAGDEGGHDGGRGLHQRTEDGPCTGLRRWRRAAQKVRKTADNKVRGLSVWCSLKICSTGLNDYFESDAARI